MTTTFTSGPVCAFYLARWSWVSTRRPNWRGNEVCLVGHPGADVLRTIAPWDRRVLGLGCRMYEGNITKKKIPLAPLGHHSRAALVRLAARSCRKVALCLWGTLARLTNITQPRHQYAKGSGRAREPQRVGARARARAAGERARASLGGGRRMGGGRAPAVLARHARAAPAHAAKAAPLRPTSAECSAFRLPRSDLDPWRGPKRSHVERLTGYCARALPLRKSERPSPLKR